MTDTTTTRPSTDQAPTETPEPDAKKLFTDFGVAQDLADELRERGIVHPFPIQELSLQLGIKGHDIIGQARTGTGKTLGFGLPLLQRIDTSKAQTQALVIVPTRELCIQVADDLTVGATRGVTSIAVYGGVGYEEQIEALTTGVHVVVGTPGRTLDHLGRGNLDVSKIHTVVLDEADEMLDMGFLPDVERLLADVPEERQTLLFSATMPTAIVKLARRFMDKPTFMRADETMHETAPTVEQHFFLVHRMDKPRVLARLLQKPERGGAFVFCRTKRMCDRLVRELDDLGVTAIAVHGDLRQSSREKNLDRFRDGRADVLVATEVAARGLDVDNVTYVINYDCPDDEKMYLHRIGRTARAGQSGVAVTFAEFNEVDRVNVIRKRVGTEEDLTEVFSTSDELTELFDLPETTPWDMLAGSSNESTSNGSSSRGSSSSSSGGRRSSSSSGSNRSSGRGTDSSRDRDRSRGRSGGSSSRSSSDRSSRSTTSRTSDDSGSDSSSRRPSGSSRSSGSSDRRSDSSSRDRSRTRTRTRSRRGERRDDDGGRDTSTATEQDAGSNASSESSPNSNPSSGSSSGRKRARRNRARGGRSSRRGSGDRSSDGNSSGGRSSDTSSSDTSSSRGSSSRGSSSRGNSRRGSGGRSSGGRSSEGRSSNSSSNSGDSSGSGRSSGSRSGRDRTPTTSRGDDARGAGTPRLGRRVDVEHLP